MQRSAPEPVDPKEPIILCTFYLPYKVVLNPKKPSEFITKQCCHNPTMMFGLLDNMVQRKTYNFMWVGIIVTERKMSEQEERQANEALLKKQCYAVY
jgi:hypothetical protein